MISSTPGLFVAPEWKEGEPGVFAVILGVSRYDNLAGGATPAPETYGLGQLAVSALTAFEVFRWLTEDFYLEGVPLAKCWLLLSPTEAELAYEPRLAKNALQPTFDAARKAIGFWWQSMKELPQASAARSRSLFFFSGHGLQIQQDQHVLLPSDYLAGPARSWNDAISTANLRAGLAALNVTQQLFFVDACRNGSQQLRSKVLPGARILNEEDAAGVNPAVICPILFATAPGQQAFQQPEPGKGLSLFGTALLDGLAGKPDIELAPASKAQANTLQAVNLYALQGFVKQRVVDLLVRAGSTVVQPVQLGGIVENVAVTHLTPDAARANRLPLDAGFGRMTEESLKVPTAAQRTLRMEEKIGRGHHVFEVYLSAGEDMAAALLDKGVSPRGAAILAELFSRDNLRLSRLATGELVPSSVLLLHQVTEIPGQLSYRVELSIEVPEAEGLWLQMSFPSESSWASFLPSGGVSAPRYAFDLEVEEDAVGSTLTRLDISFSLSNPPALALAAEMWRQYRNGDPDEAVRVFLASVSDGAKELPVSALVAAMILLRANRLELLDGWLPSLVGALPRLPDASILYAEFLWRTRSPLHDGAWEEIVAILLDSLRNRNLPVIGETLAYAAGLTNALLRSVSHIGSVHGKDLVALRDRLDSALSYFQPGGLFTVYTGFEGDTIPAALRGSDGGRR